jgi:glycosyltransferase involved in cell wall biosynthesis
MHTESRPRGGAGVVARPGDDDTESDLILSSAPVLALLMDACTIIAKNYVAFARVLAESFHRHNPGGTFTTLVIDDPSGYIDPSEEPFEVVVPTDLDFPEFEMLAASYEVLELSTAVKPWLLRHLLDRADGAPISYLDPDIEVFDDLSEVEGLAERHGLVLIPHNTEPLPDDGKRPSQGDILIAGAYNLGFIALRGGEATDRLLEWWSERLRADCVVAPEEGLFVDQRWIDLVPGLVPDLTILRDPGYNVAYWNLPGRRLQKRDGRYLVNGKPLRFFHYSGFDPLRPAELSKHQTRLEVGSDPVLEELCSAYARELLQHGYREAREWPYDWARLPDGTPLDRFARRAYREALREGGVDISVFNGAGGQELLSYLAAPAQGPEGTAGVTRYLRAMYDSRPDLQRSFPNLVGEGGREFVAWARTVGRSQVPLLEGPPSAPESGEVAERTNGSPRPWGVNVAGYLTGELGVGEHARQVILALEDRGLQVSRLGVPVQGSRTEHRFEHAEASGEGPYAVNVVCVNADRFVEFARAMGWPFFAGRYSIGLWAWEVNVFPDWCEEAFEYVDEVWVLSEHAAAAVASRSPVRVTRVPLPIAPVEPGAEDEPPRLGDGYQFLFAFDYNSVFARKNPLGLVEAFRSSFPEGSDASLVLKSVNGDRHPKHRDALREAVAGQPHIHLVEEYLSPAEKNALIASCDCYVSLHRSEGFGITLAEAMYFGRPVIATGYSGNLEFMTEENSYLVDYGIRSVGAGNHPYPPEAEWAEPDIEHAARLMRHVFEHRSEAAERGRRAAEDIRRSRSPTAAGGDIERRLEEIEERRSEWPLRARAAGPRAFERPPEQEAPTIAPATPARAEARRLLGFHEPPPTPGAGRLKRFAKRALLRVLRPYTSHERNIDEQLLAAIDEVHRTLVRMDINHAEDLRSLEQRLLAEHHALPHMEDESLMGFDDPIAGRVIGYRSPTGGEAGGGYGEFEDVFRGSQKLIRDRQRAYLSFVEDRQPVLDAGCGRGEFLDLLREAEIEYMGVDLDPQMVARCRERGHEQVAEGDLNDYLERLDDGSLGAVFSAQVVEHLPFGELRRFLTVARRKLRPGGILIAETVNPHSVRALKTFWVDPTHQHPLFPEVALVLCRLAGFPSAFVFHPNGSGHAERDRFTQGEYAVIATTASA